MKIKEITRILEDIAPLSYQESYDNAGLLTGNPEWEVTQALLTLDVTEPVIDEAIARGSNLVIAHHPIIFKGLKKITGESYVERVIIKAIRHEIAIYAAHTNLDNVHKGVNNMICDRIGLGERHILSPQKRRLKKLFTFVPREHAEALRAALFEAGAGHIGRYSECSFNTEGTGTFKGEEGSHPFAGKTGKRHYEPETRLEVIFPDHLETQIVNALLKNHPYEEIAYDLVVLDNAYTGTGAGMTGELPVAMETTAFLQHLKETMRADCIRHTALLKKTVRRIAVCGGAGSFLLKAAIADGADVFVSADFKYHEFFDADHRIIIADIGHYESEQFTIELFYHVLSEKIPNFAPLKSQTGTNPITYFH